MERPTPAQMSAFVALCSHADAVARQMLPSGAVSLVGRRADGTIVAAQVVDRTGDVLEPDAVLAELGDARRQAEQMRAHAQHALIAHLALAGGDGRTTAGAVNPTVVAAEAGLSKPTVYQRLRETSTAVQ